MAYAATCTYSGASSSPPSSCHCSRACSTAGHTGHIIMAAYGTIMVLALSCAPYPAMLLLPQMPRRAGDAALQPAGPTKPPSPLSHAHCSHVTMSRLPAAGAVPWKAHARGASCHAQPHMQCWPSLLIICHDRPQLPSHQSVTLRLYTLSAIPHSTWHTNNSPRTGKERAEQSSGRIKAIQTQRLQYSNTP